MAMMKTDPSGFDVAIREAIRDEVRRIVAEEALEAVKKVERRIGEAADRLALHVLQHYRVQDRGMEIQITVQKPASPERDK